MSDLCQSRSSTETFMRALRLKNRERAIQYLKLTKEMRFNDLSGRWTIITEGAVGYVLDEEEITVLHGATWEKKQRMVEEMMSAYDNRQIYALVGGYPCPLRKNEYVILNTPPCHCIGELI